MTGRVPDTGLRVRERERLVAKLRRDMAALERIPAGRRLVEHVDERQATIIAMLADIEAGRQLV